MSPSPFFTIKALKYSLLESHLTMMFYVYSNILHRAYALPTFEQLTNSTLQQGMSTIKNGITMKARPYRIMPEVLQPGFDIVLSWASLLTGITKEPDMAVVRISCANLSFDSKDPQLSNILLSAT